MIDMDIVRGSGGDQESLKKLFSEDKEAKTGKNNEKLRPLYDRIRSRIQEGVTYSIKNYKLYYALDLAWNTPLRQTSYTLLESLIDSNPDDAKVKKALTDWGLTHEAVRGVDSKTVNIPVFTQVFLPLCRAYLTIRWAKIVNDRRIYPLMRYDTHDQSEESRVMGDVITDRVQAITQQYDYFTVIKQAVFQMLHYGFCLQFPMESWHDERQPYKENGETKERFIKEGIRYHTPHPTRTYFDLSHRLSTINSDTGVQYLGYWTIRRFRDISDNKDWWNLDSVGIGSTDWVSKYPTFFSTAGAACTITFPSLQNPTAPGVLDREKEIGFYSSDLGDSGVMYTEHFEKLNPKKEGLFDYDYDIWMRFVVASDDTILYAEPLPYAPAIYYGYDSNENQYLNSSLTLEVLPFQDKVSNLLTQYILSVKQNLANLNLLDRDALAPSKEEGQTLISELQNWGEKWFRDLNFRWFSSRKNRVQQSDISQAVQSFKFTPVQTDTIISCVRQILDLLERTLVLSAQEVAQAATHEQTAVEIHNIAQSTSTRLTFTATPVDQAIYAMKVQLYKGLMAYGEPEFYANLNKPVSPEALEKLGFTVESPWSETSRNLTVKAKTTARPLYTFASTRDGDDRVNTASVANAMSQMLGVILQDQRIRQVIGDDQAIEFINMISKNLGLPKDFRLRATGQALPPQEELMQMLQQLQQSILTEVAEGVKPIGEAVSAVEQAIEGVAAKTQANSEQIAGQAEVVTSLAELVRLSSNPQVGTPPIYDDSPQTNFVPQPEADPRLA